MITDKCNNEAMSRSVLNLSIIKQPSNLLRCRTAHKCTGYAFVLCGSTFIYFIWLNSLSVYQYMYLPGFFNYFFHTLVFIFSLNALFWMFCLLYGNRKVGMWGGLYRQKYLFIVFTFFQYMYYCISVNFLRWSNFRFLCDLTNHNILNTQKIYPLLFSLRHYKNRKNWQTQIKNASYFPHSLIFCDTRKKKWMYSIISVMVCKTGTIIFLLWEICNGNQDYIFIKDLIHSNTFDSIPFICQSLARDRFYWLSNFSDVCKST